MAIAGPYEIKGVGNKHLRSIIKILNMAKEFQLNDPGFLHLYSELVSEKKDNPVTIAKNTVLKPVTQLLSHTSDRIFPLETVELKGFNQKHDKNIRDATIHIGPNADYYARSQNLLAFVIMDHIYFRSNKFNTTTEEGRMLLNHELTHVAQNNNKENKKVEELEFEAEQAENMEIADPDPVENVTICGKTYQLRKSKQKEIVRITVDYIIDWMEEQKFILDENEYLKLLLGYKEIITGFETIYNVKTKADCWMERELKKELRWRSGL